MPKKSKCVLVVDDESDARQFVRAVAEDLGLAAIEAADGEQGLAAARNMQPDLIVLDVQMPKLDGYSVFAELRKDPATRAIPVVMLTGVSARTGVAINADQMGQFVGSEPDAYIDKPIEPALLSDTLQRLLGV
jgi:CheY-like chemotaxis protein